MLTEIQLRGILDKLRSLPHESEWVEFKENNARPDDIGEYISALANSAALLRQEFAYMVWGVNDTSHEVVGTSFKPKKAMGSGSHELESWLAVHLKSAVDFRFHEFDAEGRHVVLLEIPACSHTPVRWKEIAYIRVGSYKKKLNEFPEKERSLWRILSSKNISFEKEVCSQGLSDDNVLSLLNFASYYELTSQTLPSEKKGILERLEQEGMITKLTTGLFDVTKVCYALGVLKCDIGAAWPERYIPVMFPTTSGPSSRRT